MRDIPSGILDFEKLTSVFGYWPSFHDAEVINISLSRDRENSRANLTADIHVFEMTDQVAEGGHFVCRHHSIISILFSEIDKLKIEEFNHQNVLMGLSIEDVSSHQLERVKLTVCFEPAYGFLCEFVCYSAQVLSVKAGIPPGSVYS